MHFDRFVRLLAASIVAIAMMAPATLFATDSSPVSDDVDSPLSMTVTNDTGDDVNSEEVPGNDNGDDTGTNGEVDQSGPVTFTGSVTNEEGEPVPGDDAPGNGDDEPVPNPITIWGSVLHASTGKIAGALVCINDSCVTAEDGTFSVTFADRGDGEFAIAVTADGYDPDGAGLSISDYKGSDFEIDIYLVLEGSGGGNWAYDPEAPVEVCVVSDGNQSDATYRLQDLIDQGLVYIGLPDGINLIEGAEETLTLGPCEPGGGAQDGVPPHDGSYNDPESGNSFEFLTALRMCEDNSLVTTWTGSNISDVNIAVYSPANGWGTDWLETDAASGSISTPIEQDTPYLVDAGVYFADGTIVVVNIDVPDCTAASDADNTIPNAGIGESSLRVQFVLPDERDIEGAPYGLYAPVASVQFMADPFLTGVVGPNNTIAIDGLIPGPYKLVVSPAEGDPIEATVTVGEQSVTEARVTVDADGNVAVSYIAQGESAEEATDAVADADATQSEATSETGVTGLPSTGAGQSSVSGALWLATAATVMMAAGALLVRPKRA